MNIGDEVYYARALPRADIFEVQKLRIRTKKGNYYVGVDVETHQTHDFYDSHIDKTIFLSKKKATEAVKAIKKQSRDTYEELDYDDFSILD